MVYSSKMKAINMPFSFQCYIYNIYSDIMSNYKIFITNKSSLYLLARKENLIVTNQFWKVMWKGRSKRGEGGGLKV
jgi:hypothetical protein